MQSVSASASQRTRAIHVNTTPLNAPSLDNSHVPADGHLEPEVPSCASPGSSCGTTRSRTVLPGVIAAIVAVMEQPASIMVVSASRLLALDLHGFTQGRPRWTFGEQVHQQQLPRTFSLAEVLEPFQL